MHEIRDIGRVIRLHMLDDQIIRSAGSKHPLNVVQPFMGEMCVDGVKNSCFFVKNHVGVVGNAVLDRILSLEQIHGMVIDAYVLDIVCNFHWQFTPLFCLWFV